MARKAIVLGLVTAGVVIAATTWSRSSQTASSETQHARWSDVANRACQRMQDRYSALGRHHWKPLYVYPPRQLARIARLRREFLEIHIEALREIETQAPARTRVQTRAIALYRRMLMTIPPVIAAAERHNLRVYDKANVRMVRAIQATRDAFARGGTSNICNWGI